MYRFYVDIAGRSSGRGTQSQNLQRVKLAIFNLHTRKYLANGKY